MNKTATAIPVRPGSPNPAAAAARPKLTRAQQSARRAQELLDAAWAEFCEKGYEGVTIEAVADRAGYSRQPVYTIFGDKQNLFFELQRASIGAVNNMLYDMMKAGQPLRANLARLASFVAQQLNADAPPYGQQLFFVAQTIALSRPELAKRMETEARGLVQEFAGMIKRSTLAAGEELRGSPEAIASHLSGIINGLTTVQFQTRERHADEQDLKAIFCSTAFR